MARSSVFVDADRLGDRLHGERAQRAMGFNRLVDARHDALNPRTSMRELPRGAMTTTEAAAFVVMSSVAFVFGASRLNDPCASCSLRWRWRSSSGIRSPGGTAFTQFFLGLAMAVAPVGGWLAAGGGAGVEPWLLGLAIGLWVGGFDILYACQDVDFDLGHGLRSIPTRFGVPQRHRSLPRHARGDDRRDGRAVASRRPARVLSRRRRIQWPACWHTSNPW